MSIKYNLNNYETIILDCDGVLFDSNPIKNNAFYETTIQYGEKNAKKLMDYNTNHGGLSRYFKFEYFFSKILDQKPKENEIQLLLDFYSLTVFEKLLKCRITKNLIIFLEKYKNKKLMVVSGGDQYELIKLFKKKKYLFIF